MKFWHKEFVVQRSSASKAAMDIMQAGSDGQCLRA